MKLTTIYYIFLAVCLFAIFITPYEAALFNQDLKYMYMLNFFELCLFAYGVSYGYFIKKQDIRGVLI